MIEITRPHSHTWSMTLRAAPCMAAALLVVGGVACDRAGPAPEGGATTPGAAPNSLAASLREREPATDERGAWRSVLGWSDDCQQAFELSAAGTGSGLQFLALHPELTVVAVLCAAGAYQPSFVYYLADTGGGQVAATLLEFPTYESPDGQSLIATRQSELWGEPSLLPASGELAVLSLARQTGDCGTWARYGFDDGSVELREFWAALPCPTEIQPPADPAPGSPPAGWTKVEPQ